MARPRTRTRTRRATSFRLNIDDEAIDAMFTASNGPLGPLLTDAADRVVRSARRRAPKSKHGSHGRKAGYLRSQINWQERNDEHGLYIDITTAALNPHDGKPYGLFQEFRRPYLRPALKAARRSR